MIEDSKNSSNMRVFAKRNVILFSVLLILLVFSFVANLLFGSIVIPVKEAFQIFFKQGDNELWSTVLIGFRLPKAITALVAGVALSISGLQMQTIFRNPLAGPYVLGITSGASLGVAIMLLGVSSGATIRLSGLLTSFSLAGAAILGSMLVLLVVLAVSVRVKDIMTILILGMMFGSATSALVSILQFFSNESMLKAFVIWTMGSLSSVAGMQLHVFVGIVLLGVIISLLSIPTLNILQLGDTYSQGVGLNVRLARATVFFSTSLLAGSVTAFCGPIGFIGIVIPHMARMLFKTSNHAVLVPGVILLGGTCLLVLDTIAQIPGQSLALPINSVTALMGVPIVVYVVLKNKRFTGL